jgi:hypothetical protein
MTPCDLVQSYQTKREPIASKYNEDGDSIFLKKKFGNSYQIIRRHIQDDNNLYGILNMEAVGTSETLIISY